VIYNYYNLLQKGDKMSTKELSIINYEDRKVIDTLKATVAKGTTDHELDMFIQQCKGTGLNPFKKEIWCIVTGTGEWRKVQMMTGLHGYLQIANSHPQFDGIEYSYGPTIKVQAGQSEIEAYQWVEARVYRKDRTRPQAYRAEWSESKGDLVSKNGKLMQWALRAKYMLQKVAECHALKRAFAQELSGFYTEEEMPAEFSVVETEKVEAPAPVEVVFPENEEGIKIRYTYDVAKWVLESDENVDKINGLLKKVGQRFWANYDANLGLVQSEHELPNLKRFEVAKDLNLGGTWSRVAKPEEIETEEL
jgi:phage recombination protein Bet